MAERCVELQGETLILSEFSNAANPGRSHNLMAQEMS